MAARTRFTEHQKRFYRENNGICNRTQLSELMDLSLESLRILHTRCYGVKKTKLFASATVNTTAKVRATRKTKVQPKIVITKTTYNDLLEWSKSAGFNSVADANKQHTTHECKTLTLEYLNNKYNKTTCTKN
jgi:hypothetical protein